MEENVNHLATTALLSTTLAIALGVEPGWPAERLSNADLAKVYAGAVETGNPGGRGNGNGNGNVGNNNGNGNTGNNNGNGNIGNNNGNGNSSNNNGNGNSSSGNGNGSFLNSGGANFTDATGAGKDMLAGIAGIPGMATRPPVGVLATGGYLSLLPGQGLLPMAGLLATQAMPGLIPAIQGPK